MTTNYVVLGAADTGSVPVEAALTLIGAPFDVVEEPALYNPKVAFQAVAVNPLRQVPALVLPSGEVMTESSAILTYLADIHPAARLSPGVQDPTRPQFLRWMAYVSAAIYSLYWIRDDLSRLAADKAHEAVIAERTAQRIAHCWRLMDEQVTPGRFILGQEITVLDLYVTAVSRWSPRRRRFYEAAPKLSEVVRRVDADPRLADLWSRRMPFVEGWEG